jgi:hypothetical protein
VTDTKNLSPEEHIRRAKEHLDAAEAKTKPVDEWSVEDHLANLKEGR